MRLIDADEYIEKLRDRIGIEPSWNHGGLRIAIFELHKMPTIDPVKHGKWIKRAKTNPDAELCSDYDWECSECGKMDTHNEKVEVKYCWNCGSRMDGEQR